MIKLAANGARYSVEYAAGKFIVYAGTNPVHQGTYIKVFLPKPCANCVLFQLSPLVYFYCGLNAHTFKLPKDEKIKRFVSPRAVHNDVPYAWIETNTRVFLLTECVAVPREIVNFEDPYQSLYLHKEPKLRKYLSKYLYTHATYPAVKFNFLQ